MARKPCITNREIIKKLVKKGLWTKSPLEYVEEEKPGTRELRTVCTKSGPFHTLFQRSDPRWYMHRPEDLFSFMIPIDAYKEHISSYRVMLKKGTRVRLRKQTTRKYDRSEHTNDLKDTKSWEHLGMGSGKMYFGQKIEEIMDRDYGYSQPTGMSTNRFQRRYHHFTRQLNPAILIGNDKYASNLIRASDKAQYYKNAGIKRQDGWHRGDAFKAKDFIKFTEIKGDGVFGPKQLVNGYITNVYVHFLFPKWESKRESRYEVLFESGAKGIFTYDYLDKVWDTDFEADESMYRCSESNTCPIECTHRKYHMEQHDCGTPCYQNEKANCTPVYDYRNFMETTSGKALDCVDEQG